jgi:subtilisin family serine protease
MRLRFRWESCVVALPLSLLVTACSDRSPLAPPDNATGGAVAPSFSQATFAARGGRQSDRVLILIKSGAQPTRVKGKVGSMGGRLRHQNDQIGVMSVEGLTDQQAAALAADTDVETVARDVTINWLPPMRGLRAGPRFRRAAVQPQTDQSGALAFGIQWNMQVIRANAAWKVTNQGRRSLVCVLDTGVDPTHLDLQGKIDLNKSASMLVGEPEISDFFFHGTAVSSLIASNGIVMASVAPDAQLCAVKVLDKTGSGSFDDILSGIIFAVTAGADVINMSFGAVISTKEPGAKDLIKALTRAVDFATDHGVLVVAAAGNESIDFNTAPRDLRELPAQIKGVLSVGATAPVNQQNFDQLASYTNFGSKGVDVFAPGGDFVEGKSDALDLILAACSNFSDPKVLGFDCRGGYLLAAGTSFSSPHTAGEAAVIESQTRRDDPARRLTHCIEIGADPLTGRRFDPVFAFGRIDVLGGVNCQRFI